MKMKTLLCLLGLSISACGGSSASTSTETTAPASESSEIPRADFIAMMVEMLPPAICNNDQHPLRVCVDATAADCTTKLELLARSCAEMVTSNIPEMVPDTEEAGERYGFMLGSCMGIRYAQQARADGKFHSNDPNCINSDEVTPQ